MMRAALEQDAAFLALLMDSGRGENGLTEFLAGLLRVPPILRAFLHHVIHLHPPDDVLRTATVTSEDEAACEKGVPDISIRSGDDLFVLVENRLGAPFTDNQPHEYVRSLASWKAERPTGTAVTTSTSPSAASTSTPGCRAASETSLMPSPFACRPASAPVSG
jgi:hypothetical protein